MNGENKKIAIIGGARPNFMKIAPLVFAFQKFSLSYYIVNAGQHFDKAMAQDFFDEFKIQPDYQLTPSQESTVKQFADIMKGIEEIFIENPPSLVVVVGDVNATLAAALVSNKMNIPLAHVEAGLRSFNKKMPEENNRILTDQLSDLLFVTMEEGEENLKKEQVKGQIHQVGNIMIDTLVQMLPEIKTTDEKFYFCTLHRAENVDSREVFEQILQGLEEISKDAPIYLPLHPRTKKMVEQFGFMERIQKIFRLLPPLSYRESLYYQKNAILVLTDSGGIQEETSYLGVPCLTLRSETERPITVTQGTNVIAGVTKQGILAAYKSISKEKRQTNIPLWDGKAAERIATILKLEI